MRAFKISAALVALLSSSTSFAQIHDHADADAATAVVTPVKPASKPGKASIAPAAGAPSRYLLAFAGDDWKTKPWSDDFLVTFDLATGQPIASTPIGRTGSMPHHTEYVLPVAGEKLWANAHHAEEILLLDWSNPKKIEIALRLKSPPPLRFPHDFKRLPDGAMMVGFLRSEGPSPEAGDQTMPGNHGGIAEYRPDGTLVRTSSAAVEGLANPVRPYSFLEIDRGRRLITTSALMMEKSSADVVQIWRRSDLKLVHTLVVPAGSGPSGKAVPSAAGAPFAAKTMADGSILVSTYGCGFYRLTGAEGESPKLTHVLTISPDSKDDSRGSCGVPVIRGKY